MSDKLPEGWACVGGDHWRHINEATADMHRPHGLWRAAVYGPDRPSKAEAETDRLNMIAGLEGRPTPDLGAAQKEIDTLHARLEASAERHDAVVEKLDAIGVPHCGGLVDRIGALADRSADKDAIIKLGVELLSVRTERDNLRHTIATRQDRIDNLTAEASDKAPQLLRDSMRMTQEENARLRVKMAMLAAKVDSCAAHIEQSNLSHARTVQERNTCMARMDSLRADLAKVSEGYARVKGERDACAADVTALRKQLHALRDERDALLKDRSLTRLERAFSEVEKENESMKAEAARFTAEIATLTARATAAEGYAQHLLAALNAVSGFKGMP